MDEVSALTSRESMVALRHNVGIIRRNFRGRFESCNDKHANSEKHFNARDMGFSIL